MPKHIPRIFVEDLDSPEFCLTESQFHHLFSVLRLRPGDEFLAFNPKAGEWSCQVKEIRKKTMLCEKSKQLRELVSQPKLALAFCPIKNENMKLIFEKGTELGVSDFFPVVSQNTNAKINIEKMEMITILAAEQSERLDIPKIHDISSLEDFLENLPENFEWFSCVERMQNQQKADFSTKACGFIVGPEGGFSEQEKEILSLKTSPISLSRNILRSETAAIACLSIWNFQQII